MFVVRSRQKGTANPEPQVRLDMIKSLQRLRITKGIDTSRKQSKKGKAAGDMAKSILLLTMLCGMVLR